MGIGPGTGRVGGSLEDSMWGEGPVSLARPPPPARALGCLVGVECSIS